MVGLGLLPSSPMGIAATANQALHGNQVFNGKTQIC
jgi:hypothetical protein